MPGGSEFSHCRRPGVAPAPAPQSSSSPVAQSAASGRWPEVSPSPGGSGLPRTCGPRPPLAGWLGASSHLRPEISPCRMAPGPPRPVARGVPLPGGSGPPQARGPEAPRCRVAPGPPGRWPEASRCRWLRISPGRRPADARCRVARGWPLAGGAEFPLCRRLRVFPYARGREEIPIAGWLQKALFPVVRGPSFAGWLRGFPLCQWLRVSPSPATVPGGEEISTPVRTGRTRGLHQQFQDSLAVHKPSTVNPGLSPATVVSPPNTPQRGPQAGRVREPG